jgi:hypothetical protein
MTSYDDPGEAQSALPENDIDALPERLDRADHRRLYLVHRNKDRIMDQSAGVRLGDPAIAAIRQAG